MPKERVDVLAYKQGLFETREQAKRGVMAGLVVNVINGERYDKPGEKIDEAIELKLKGEKLKYVSRGGLKLEKALAVFDIDVTGAIGLDIGASTGGFTDVLLQNGAQLVYAVDVGTNQLAWKLRQDARVRSMEQYNFRYAEETDFTEGRPVFASIDVSFISLSLILPALHRILADGGHVVALIKPQFEAGREQIGKNGIVKDKAVHQKVLEKVTTFAVDYGFSVKALDFSPIQGGHGNIEFLAHLEKATDASNTISASISDILEKAHEEFKKNEEKGTFGTD
ncbi:TlyA family RNA methyltransferase [Streptococcus plurextorum]|uniref:TlyA family RNA methyltransferase n=1 Tax=Streptococcus plurextorum TaxID=456876 RepID=UPI0004146BCD|nr:TlyA family RNA methyltransferase [Streptococcus plurextorum]